MTPFPLTPNEASRWESLRPMFLTSSGEHNAVMTDAYVQSAKKSLPCIDFNKDYSKQFPLLLVFLKSYPQYLPEVLPTLYKIGNKQEAMRFFLDDVHQHAPEVLSRMLTELFVKEKTLAMQIPLLMDMARYVEVSVFALLDFTLLLKATPEKIVKACTPTPATWDALMDLATGLVNNAATKALANGIACSVGLQVSTAKKKDAKAYNITQYDWLETAHFWKKHGWEWNAGAMLDIANLRAKGESLVPDMVYAMANSLNGSLDKAQQTIDWINARGLPATPHAYQDLDEAVLYLYKQNKSFEVNAGCLAWFNARAEHCAIFQYAWHYMPAEDMRVATQKMVAELLAPMGATKASLLSGFACGNSFPSVQLRQCGPRIYTLLDSSDLPLGDMNSAMNIILHQWTHAFPTFDASKGAFDHRQPAMHSVFDTIAYAMQEPTRQALQTSNAFKQLVLYAAYVKDLNKEEWDKYTFQFMPDLTDKPLSLLSVVYPEHQNTWAQVQEKVLNGTFKREDTVQLIAKVLFNQHVTVDNINSTCLALECTPEVFFCSLHSNSSQVFIPESFDLTEMPPVEQQKDFQ